MILNKFPNQIATFLSNNLLYIRISSKYSRVNNSWAADSKLVSGYSDGSSGFNDDITREQLAVLLYRYARLAGKLGSFEKSELSAYSDASSISDFAKEAMEWANAAGLIKGRSENALEPKGTATRAEMAALLQRFIEGMAE